MLYPNKNWQIEFTNSLMCQLRTSGLSLEVQNGGNQWGRSSISLIWYLFNV